MANNTNLSYPLYYNQQFFDKNGNPLSNGKLYTYEAGTSTSIVTYKTIGEESSANMNTNPIILDSSGYAKLVVKKGLYYRFVLKDKNDSFVNEWDNVSSVDISSGSLSSIRIRGKDNEIDVEESESGGVKTFLIKLASHIKNVINGKKDKQEPLVFNGSAVKTIKKLIQNENGNVDVEFENIELPEPSWGVFKSAVLHTDTTAQHLHLTLDAYSGDSISLQSNAIMLGVGDYLVCGTLEIQGPTTPSPDYERITFGIFNSESSYDVDCSETAKKVIPFCTIVNNVTQNYSDMFDVQCTKAGVSVTLTSLTITAIVTSTSNSESGISIVKNGGALTDAASVNVPNNSLSTLATSQEALTLNVACGENEVPNFAVEITAGAAVTLTVTKTVGSTTTTLKYAEAAGNTLESGKFYQVTCVGSCWTLAEFTQPTP